MSDNKNNSDKNVILKGEEALLLDHNYDGIQELDYPLPKWWLGILYLTIAFSFVYVGYYMVGPGPSLRDELDSSIEKLEALAPPTSGGDQDEDNLRAAINDPESAKRGQVVFAGKCMACHGDKGQGVIGPNLTDDNWLHGNAQASDLAKVIKDGIADKGMPPWGPILTSAEVVDVIAFIRSIHGSNPPGAKEPQGDKKEWTL